MDSNCLKHPDGLPCWKYYGKAVSVPPNVLYILRVNQVPAMVWVQMANSLLKGSRELA